MIEKQFFKGLSLSHYGQQHIYKGLATKELPTPCRMAPPQRSDRTPALGYRPLTVAILYSIMLLA